MVWISRSVETRYPPLIWEHSEAIRHTAIAGDATCQYRYGAWALNRAGTVQQLWRAFNFLQWAAKQEFWPAQWALAQFAARGVFGRRFWIDTGIYSIRALINACISSPPPLAIDFRARVRSVSRPVRGESPVYDLSVRNTLDYESQAMDDGHIGRCDFEVHRGTQAALSVLLIDYPHQIAPTLRSCLTVRPTILIHQLLLDGYDLDPSNVRWYHVSPNNEFRRGVFEVHIHWDPTQEGYEGYSPCHVDPRSVPFDLTNLIDCRGGLLWHEN